MRWSIILVLAGMLGGCTEYREVAYAPSVTPSLVGFPVIETDLFATEVRDYYRRRIAEQGLPPGQKVTQYSYYERKSWY